MKFIEFCSVHDVQQMEWQGNRLLNLLYGMDAYDALGFLVWMPKQKAFGSFDIEHDNLTVLRGVKWKSLLHEPAHFIDRILDGEYEDVSDEMV